MATPEGRSVRRVGLTFTEGHRDALECDGLPQDETPIGAIRR